MLVKLGNFAFAVCSAELGRLWPMPRQNAVSAPSRIAAQCEYQWAGIAPIRQTAADEPYVGPADG